jgi:hypothetical protein
VIDSGSGEGAQKRHDERRRIAVPVEAERASEESSGEHSAHAARHRDGPAARRGAGPEEVGDRADQ